MRKNFANATIRYCIIGFALAGAAKSASAQMLWHIPDTNGWNIQNVAISSNGEQCFVNTGKDYRCYRISDALLLSTFGPVKGPGIAIDSSGQFVAFAADSGKIEIGWALWGGLYGYLNAPDSFGDCVVQTLDWSRDGKYIVAGYSRGDYRQFVILWYLPFSLNPKPLWRVDFDSLYFPANSNRGRLAVDFNPTGEFIGIKQWAGGSFLFKQNGQELKDGAYNGEGPVPFSPDGRHEFEINSQFNLLDSTYRKVSFSIGGVSPISYIADSRVFGSVTPDAGWFEIDDLDVGRVRTFAPVDTPMNYLAVSADGSTAVTGGRALIVWDLSRYAAVNSPKSKSASLRAFEDNSRITVAIPQGESGRVFIYRSDGQCYFDASVEFGTEHITTPSLPFGAYFIIFQPSSGEKAFTKVSIFQ